MRNRTLAIIKPDAVRRRLTGKIIDRFLTHGFDIVALEQVDLSKDQAKRFYAVHTEKPFFNDLVDFMTSGACIAMVLEKNNAVQELRYLMGATDPEEAAERTIRSEFGDSIQQNVVHGSDSDKNASKEIAFFFPSVEIPIG